ADLPIASPAAEATATQPTGLESTHPVTELFGAAHSCRVVPVEPRVIAHGARAIGAIQALERGLAHAGPFRPVHLAPLAVVVALPSLVGLLEDVAAVPGIEVTARALADRRSPGTPSGDRHGLPAAGAFDVGDTAPAAAFGRRRQRAGIPRHGRGAAAAILL